MTSEAEKSQKLTELRQRAEELLKKRQNLPPADWPEDFKKLFHELETHQIELEIQNEELRRAQEELSASREHFADLYDNSPAGYVTLSDKALIRRANLTFANMLGVPREWLSGRSLSEFVAHDDQDRLYLGCKTLLKEKKRHVMELRLQKRDGGPFWTRLECIPVPSGRQDGTINIRVVLTDITERKLAEEDLLQATDELKRSNEDFQQFAHVVSHDLQEPLRVVTLFLELLQKRSAAQLDDKSREYISHAIQGATRMSQLIKDLLDFSRVSSRSKSPQLYDSNKALAEALFSLSEASQQAGATVTYEELPTVMVNHTLLIQLLQNLIGNAIKFCSSASLLSGSCWCPGKRRKVAVFSRGQRYRNKSQMA